MTNLQTKNGAGVDDYLNATGTGTDLDPHVVEHAATIVAGADVTQGNTTDAAVITDTTGTVSGKLRGLVKWAFERMPASLGQKVKTASLPVVLASDQDALAVTGPLTDTQLRATPVPVSGTVTASGPLTDTQLRATPVPVSGTVASTVADGASVALGAVADAASATSTVEDTTARTGIGLWKGIKNLLKLINDKLVSGTDIGDVTINNAAGAAAVNVQDGGNALTVDGTVAATSALLGGATSDAAVSTDATGSIHQYLRGLVKLIVAKINIATVDTVTAVTTVATVTTVTNKVGSTVAAGDNVTEGNTTDAAVSTDAAGTLSAKLRGLIVLMVNFLSRFPAALAANGGLKVEGVAGGVAQPISGAVTADLTKIAGASVVVDNGTAATSLRVTVASDSTGQIKLAAGTAGIGKLTANSGVDIGDVDVTSLPAIPAGEYHIGAVGGNTTTITVTPTLTVHATYAANDYVGESGTAMAFANAARVNTGSGVILGAVLVDYALQSVACELWLFDASVTPPNDSAAWTISDADALKCIGVILFSVYYASALNSVSPGQFPNGNIPFKSTGTSLWGALVTRGAPAYASGDVSVRLVIAQD